MVEHRSIRHDGRDRVADIPSFREADAVDRIDRSMRCGERIGYDRVDGELHRFGCNRRRGALEQVDDRRAEQLEVAGAQLLRRASAWRIRMKAADGQVQRHAMAAPSAAQ